MRQSSVLFKAGDLNFEGVVSQPNDVPGPFPGIVICHPHPLFGGNMDNNVVLAVAYALVDHGFATLRFNFRGVGSSEGQHTKGDMEQQEVLGALEVMKSWPKVNRRRLGLVGYSFGASVVLGNPALHAKFRAFALISPSLRALEESRLQKNKRPALVIAGDRDKLVQSEQLPSTLEKFGHPPDCRIVAGADHYWNGYEDQLAPQVAEFFAEALK